MKSLKPLLKTTLTTSLAMFWIAIQSPALAELPDLGPPPGTNAVVTSPDSTIPIYKTQKVWEDLKSGDTPSWENPRLSIIESGAKVRITRRASLDDAVWFLSEVKVLSGRHSGETWWIHTRVLKVIGSVKK